MILLGSTCHRVKKCGKIPLAMAKCGNQFASHTFCGLPHLLKVSCGRLWLATKHSLHLKKKHYLALQGRFLAYVHLATFKLSLLQADCSHKCFVSSDFFSIVPFRLFKLYWRTTNLRRCKMMTKVPMMLTTSWRRKARRLSRPLPLSLSLRLPLGRT